MHDAGEIPGDEDFGVIRNAKICRDRDPARPVDGLAEVTTERTTPTDWAQPS